MTTLRRSKTTPTSYVLNGTYTEDALIGIAKSILESRLYQRDAITSSEKVKQYLKLHFCNLKNEVFCIIFLSNQHDVLACEDVFTGTIDGACVYPREVVRKVIEHNAAAVILAHNHPSGHATPSQADRRITERLKKALELIDTRILDHLVVGDSEITSFAERGWL